MTLALSLSIITALAYGGFHYYHAIENALSGSVGQKEQQKADHVETEAADEPIVKLSDDQTGKMELKIETAGPGEMTIILTTSGKIILDPDRLAHIIPKVSGVAKEAKKNIGSLVKAGEVIAILESQEMADLKAAYLTASGKEKMTLALYEKEESLYQKHISPIQDYLNAQSAWEEARINLQLLTQKLQAFGITDRDLAILSEKTDPELREYKIYSPIDGTVLMRHITNGEFIDQHKTIYEIADLSTVWVETGIYPKELSRIREGQSVEVVNMEDASIGRGTLIYLSPTLIKETIAAKAIARLDNPSGQWRPGQYVNLRIATDQISSPLVINKEAIQKVDGCDCTFVQTEKGFEKRKVKLGRSDHQIIEVISGLNPGEKYVSKNPFLLKAELNKDSAKDED